MKNFHNYKPKKMEQTECSETSAYKIQTQGKKAYKNFKTIFIKTLG